MTANIQEIIRDREELQEMLDEVNEFEGVFAEWTFKMRCIEGPNGEYIDVPEFRDCRIMSKSPFLTAFSLEEREKLRAEYKAELKRRTLDKTILKGASVARLQNDARIRMTALVIITGSIAVLAVSVAALTIKAIF